MLFGTHCSEYPFVSELTDTGSTGETEGVSRRISYELLKVCHCNEEYTEWSWYRKDEIGQGACKALSAGN